MNDKSLVEAIYYSSNLEKVMLEDRERFLNLYNAFDKKQEEHCFKSCKDQTTMKFLQPLLQDGVVKVENMFSKKDLRELKDFSNYMDYGIRHNQSILANHPANSDNVESIAGYLTPGGSLKILIESNFNLWQEQWLEGIHCHQDPNNILFSSSKDPWDGQIRMQSKTWRGHLPGAGKLAKNKLLCNIFAHYNSLPQVIINNSNLEWILPCKKNHNGWHRDCATHQLKAMVLLNDVDEYSAPLLYALKSHRTTTDFDKQHLYDRFCLSGEHKYDNPNSWKNIRNSWPEHSRKKEGSHCGYIDDNSAPNDILPKDRIPSQIEIGESTYEMFVGTGKAGDVIIFDSCGLHSGSRSHTKTRRNITFSSTRSLSLKRAFFTGIRKFS